MLEDYPKEVILKDGTGVTLRPLERHDDVSLYELYACLSEDDRWFLEGDVTDFEFIKSWVKKMDRNRINSIVAVLGGKTIASATLLATYFGAKRHIGKIRISVHPEFREKNLATWMLFDLINLAMAMELELLTMRLVEDKDSSLIRGLRRLGFSEEAFLGNYLKDREGNPHNLVIMIKRLQRVWDSMEAI